MNTTAPRAQGLEQEMKILNSHQAEAIANALANLNSVMLKAIDFELEVGPVQRVRFRMNSDSTILIQRGGGVEDEQYDSQSDFLARYGL